MHILKTIAQNEGSVVKNSSFRTTLSLYILRILWTSNHYRKLMLICGLSALSIFGQQQSPNAAISIELNQTEIRDALRMISKAYGISIVIDQDVQGLVTLNLNNVPIVDGLNAIAKALNYEVAENKGIYQVRRAANQANLEMQWLDERLTLDIVNYDIRTFLSELSKKTGVSVVPESGINGRISGKLYNVALEDGIRSLLEPQGFAVEKRRNILQVLSTKASGQKDNAKFFVDYSAGLVTLDVLDAKIGDIVQTIANQGNVQLITYTQLHSTLNARLDKAPLDKALALLLAGTPYTFVQQDNVLLIGERSPNTVSGKPLSTTELIHLKHIKADNIPTLLPKDLPESNIRILKEQNALLVSGTSEELVFARRFLASIDIPTPQVRIDAVIVEYKEDLDKSFGIWHGRGKSLAQSGGFYTTPSPETRRTTANSDMQLGFSIQDINTFLSTVINSGTQIKSLPQDFLTILRFLETENKARVLAQPSVLTLNGNRASIDVSETQYFEVTIGTGEDKIIKIEPIKAGIQLDITPWISQSGQITAEVKPVVSNSEQSPDPEKKYPIVSSRSIATTVRFNDGETLVLGGLIKNQNVSYTNKIPLLSKIPLVGALFRNSGHNRVKSNLVVYITPHIAHAPDSININQIIDKFDEVDDQKLNRSTTRGAVLHQPSLAPDKPALPPTPLEQDSIATQP